MLHIILHHWKYGIEVHTFKTENQSIINYFIENNRFDDEIELSTEDFIFQMVLRELDIPFDQSRETIEVVQRRLVKVI